MDYVFYKKHPNDKVWWVENNETIGEHLFSFDKIKVFNLFAEYRDLPVELKNIFDKENPEWKELFSE